MAFEVHGVSLNRFEDPVRLALERYTENTEGQVEFDIDAAARLVLTPEKPNSARSSSLVRFLGETAGTLYVIAFAPEDGTGDESAYRLANIGTGSYPRKPGIVPRSKAAMHTEAHLTLVSFEPDSPNVDPVMFAGSLDLLSLRGTQLINVAYLGQNRKIYTERHMTGEHRALAKATATVGYRDEGRADGLSKSDQDPRFGDPHAVVNSTDNIQVCAFLGITPEAAPENFGALRALGTRAPFLSD